MSWPQRRSARWACRRPADHNRRRAPPWPRNRWHLLADRPPAQNARSRPARQPAQSGRSLVSATRRPSSTSSALPAWRLPTSHRSRTMIGRPDERNEWPQPTPHRLLHGARPVRRLSVATECRRLPGPLVRQRRPRFREPSFVRLELCSFRPPPLQELGSRRHRVDDGHASSSSTTPTSNGSPAIEGPMNILTAASSVTNARQ